MYLRFFLLWGQFAREDFDPEEFEYVEPEDDGSSDSDEEKDIDASEQDATRIKSEL